MLELQSLPRISRHSLSLPRPASDPALTRVHHAPGSHKALFAAAREAGNSTVGEKSANKTWAASTVQSVSKMGCGGYASSSVGAESVMKTVLAPEDSNIVSATSAPIGVSVAFLMSFAARYGSQPDASSSENTTRAIAQSLKRRQQQASELGPHTKALAGQDHPVTGGSLSGCTSAYVAHAWDSDFSGLVDALVVDAAGDLDKTYWVDVFGTDLQYLPEDPVAFVQQLVAGSDEVLLVVDPEGEALRRLWVVFEALLAFHAGKLRVRCASSDGFGSSVAALKTWEAHIDAADWALADVTRKCDEKRLKAYAERVWNSGGKSIERTMAQFKMTLRQTIYSQILVAAVEAGDKQAIIAALDLGASPESQDHLGNTVEELASFNGRTDIQDLLFDRRMEKRGHLSLAEWALNPRELAKSAQANWFVTEYLNEGLEVTEPLIDFDEGLVSREMLQLGPADLSDQSTVTPNLSSRGGSTPGASSGHFVTMPP
jgi:hypothetical protein